MSLVSWKLFPAWQLAGCTHTRAHTHTHTHTHPTFSFIPFSPASQGFFDSLSLSLSLSPSLPPPPLSRFPMISRPQLLARSVSPRPGSISCCNIGYPISSREQGWFWSVGPPHVLHWHLGGAIRNAVLPEQTGERFGSQPWLQWCLGEIWTRFCWAATQGLDVLFLAAFNGCAAKQLSQWTSQWPTPHNFLHRSGNCIIIASLLIPALHDFSFNRLEQLSASCAIHAVIFIVGADAHPEIKSIVMA